MSKKITATKLRKINGGITPESERNRKNFIDLLEKQYAAGKITRAEMMKKINEWDLSHRSLHR